MHTNLLGAFGGQRGIDRLLPVVAFSCLHCDFVAELTLFLMGKLWTRAFDSIQVYAIPQRYLKSSFLSFCGRCRGENKVGGDGSVMAVLPLFFYSIKYVDGTEQGVDACFVDKIELVRS